MRARSLPSQKEQYRQLRKKGIINKQGRNPVSGRQIKGKWTIYRLYKFYVVDEHKKTDPYFQAYSLRKSTYARIEEHGPRVKVSTPAGMKTGSSFIRSQDTRTEKELLKRLPPQVTPRFGRYYKTMQHVRDEFIYSIRPPIVVSEVNYTSMMRRSEQVTREIVSIISHYLKIRGELYRNHAVGSIIHYNTDNMTTQSGQENPSGYIRVPWITIQNKSLIEAAMQEAFETAIHMIFKYPKAIVEIYRVDVYISTKFRSGNIDLIRARK